MFIQKNLFSQSKLALGFYGWNLFLLSLFFPLALPAWGQNVDISGSKISPPDYETQTPPPPLNSGDEPKLYAPNENDTQLEDIPAGPETICVKEFAFEGISVFTPDKLDKVVEEAVGKSKVNGCWELSFAQVLEVRSAVIQHYLNEDYRAVFAYIPEGQKVAREGAIITIKVLEGEVEEIQVSSSGGLSSDYVGGRLAVSTRGLLNQERLLEALRKLQRDPLIEKIEAEISQGSEQGKVILNVKVQESQQFNVQGRIDNNRNSSVGSFRSGVVVEDSSLLGQGDSLSLSYYKTDGSDDYGVNYVVPFNPYNGTIGFSFRSGEGEVIDPLFEKLDLLSDYRSYELTLRQPIYARAFPNSSNELAVGLTFSRQESETSILGVNFPLSAGADEEGRTRISALRFFQEWIYRDNEQVVFLRSQFNFGVDWFGATLKDDAFASSEETPDSEFFSWQGYGQWSKRLGANLLLLRGSAQLSSDPLVAFEQFSLGGQGTVRGYGQDARLTDNGVFASAEMQFPIYSFFEGEGVLSVAPFVDFGRVWNSKGRSSFTPRTLASVGLGLQLELQDRLRARLDYGLPLIEVESRERTLQENGVYFSVELNLF